MQYQESRTSRVCCTCGLALQRLAIYFGIADIIFGIIGMVTSFMMYKAKRDFEFFVTNSVHHRFSEYLPGHGDVRTKREFRLHWVPEEVWITFAIFHGTQFVMGAFLIGGAANKVRHVVVAWMVATAISALFTGIVFRLIELCIVYEFVIELKQEEEVTPISGYGPGESPYTPPIVASPNPPFPPSANAPNGNQPALNPHFQDPGQKQMMTLQAQSYIQDGFQMPSSVPPSQGAKNGWQQVPSALLPPPNYDSAAASDGYHNGATWDSNMGGFNPSAPNQFSSGLYPNPNPRY